MISKVELLRQAKKNGYKVDCPLVEDDSAICAECDFFGLCVHDGFLHKKKVDYYIKRYSRKKSLTTEDDVLDELENMANKELNAHEPLPEPETLKSKVMKILSPVAIIAVEEYDRLKKIEKDYILIRKVLGD